MAKYTREKLEGAVRSSTSVAGVLRYLGHKCVSGGTHTHISKRIKRFGIDTSHFMGRGWNKGGTSSNRLSAEEILVVNRLNGNKELASRIRRVLDEIGRKRVCARCGLGELWNEDPLRLEINHINNNPIDNRRENLEYLCPNCHSQITLAAIVARKKPGNQRRLKPSYCKDCGSPVRRRSVRCRDCARIASQKIVWPPVKALLAMLEGSNYSAIGRKLGVSGNAIRKHLERRMGAYPKRQRSMA